MLYHGSNIAFDKIDMGKSHNRRDFGRGFYCTVLESQAEEWAKRLYLRSHKGGIQHSYDVVVGPVADDNTMETMQLYLSGILKAEEAVERLRYNKVNSQVSFHTPPALEHLTLESRKEVV